jgi:DNA-binding GntR family transcriptional regulator
VTDDVYEVLLATLMNRRIAPGARMSIDGLARQLDVSPTPVREALARLEAEGMVQKKPNRGYTAAPVLDETGLRNLFAMRLLLEPSAAAAAAERIDDAAVAELAGIVEGMHRYSTVPEPGAEDYEGYREFAQQDALFHALVAQQSGNPLLADAVVRLRPHMHLFRLYFEHGIASQTDAEHSAILAALRARDPVAAERAMRRHVACSQDRMVGARGDRRHGAPAGPS